MSSPDAESGYLQLVPDGNAGGFDNRIAARVALQIIRYYPGRRTAEINCPVFFAICDTDSVAPAGPSLKYAEKAPHANVKLYHAGYFDIYIGEPFERAVRDQLEFLERVVPVEQRIP